MRLIFAGTSEFACCSLKSLVERGYEIPFVLTKIDRLGGRGMKVIQSPIKKLALDLGIKVLQSNTLEKKWKLSYQVEKIYKKLLEVKPDIIIVVSYGLILPKWILDLPKFFCINLHASLLPRWRGAAPIHRAIENGDKETGISIIKMNDKLDSGNILLQRKVPILNDYNSGMLHDILAQEGALAIQSILEQLSKGDLNQRVQQSDHITYAKKIEKSESMLDCSKDSNFLSRRIRAFNPTPGNTIILPGFSEPVKVWDAQALADEAVLSPGSIQKIGDFGIDIATGNGILRLLELQRSGKKRQKVKEFICGWRRNSFSDNLLKL